MPIYVQLRTVIYCWCAILAGFPRSLPQGSRLINTIRVSWFTIEKKQMVNLSYPADGAGPTIVVELKSKPKSSTRRRWGKQQEASDQCPLAARMGRLGSAREEAPVADTDTLTRWCRDHGRHRSSSGGGRGGGASHSCASCVSHRETDETPIPSVIATLWLEGLLDRRHLVPRFQNKGVMKSTHACEKSMPPAVPPSTTTTTPRDHHSEEPNRTTMSASLAHLTEWACSH
ncbi:unnamed protein product [Caenorhabditis bovis]|uniref:Uncharacterized protein n=1 Tax=Caenorhabditis bovis TaxID=2654633 RepID=A0A8S1EXK1_9PELO|nr:unnamed protein product [Caenorhabditis bovis]